eukprot:412779_1
MFQNIDHETDSNDNYNNNNRNDMTNHQKELKNNKKILPISTSGSNNNNCNQLPLFPAYRSIQFDDIKESQQWKSTTSSLSNTSYHHSPHFDSSLVIPSKEIKEIKITFIS